MTLEEFPALKEYTGKNSVTEMEILHALIDPLHRGKQRDLKKPKEYYDPVNHAFFFLRDDDYLVQFPSTPPLLRQIYTNEAILDKTERNVQNIELNHWRNIQIPKSDRPFYHYQANWDSKLSTPELLIPLHCPSTQTKSIERWRTQWNHAGVAVNGVDIQTDPLLVGKAEEFNRMLSSGRLTDFKTDKKALIQLLFPNCRKPSLSVSPITSRLKKV